MIQVNKEVLDVIQVNKESDVKHYKPSNPHVCVTDDNGYVPFVSQTTSFFSRSWLITGFMSNTMGAAGVVWTMYPSRVIEFSVSWPIASPFVHFLLGHCLFFDFNTCKASYCLFGNITILILTNNLGQSYFSDNNLLHTIYKLSDIRTSCSSAISNQQPWSVRLWMTNYCTVCKL